MTDTIWIDPVLKGLGYSSVTIFDAVSFDGHVSLGKTASCSQPFHNLLIVHAFGLSVVESRPSQIQHFHELGHENEPREEYMIKKILEVMTPDIFVKLLDETERRGVTHGRHDAQLVMRKALGL
jgi:hypothetical protein